MIKVCSFLPAVTQMLYDMGLQEHLHGVTFECPAIALLEKKVVVRCVLEGKDYTSQEIDTLFSESKRSGKSLYYVEEEVLEEIAPDIIFTQDVCDVCQIDTECTAAAVAHLEKQPLLISITPNSLNDVFENALTIATALGRADVGHRYITSLNQRIGHVVDTIHLGKAPIKRISLLEWINPIFNCGHWIPDQIRYAGGEDTLSNPDGDSVVIKWEKIVDYNPEVLVIAPCGFTIDRTMEELHLLTEKPDWNKLAAVRSNEVYVVDFDLFTQSSASTLVSGIEVLAALLHPANIELPEQLSQKVKRLPMSEALLK